MSFAKNLKVTAWAVVGEHGQKSYTRLCHTKKEATEFKRDWLNVGTFSFCSVTSGSTGMHFSQLQNRAIGFPCIEKATVKKVKVTEI